MDITLLAKESGANETGGVFPEYTFSIRELELFAKKIIAARDAEWMKEPVAWLDIENDVFRYRPPENWLPQPCIPIFAQPKEVK